MTSGYRALASSPSRPDAHWPPLFPNEHPNVPHGMGEQAERTLSVSCRRPTLCIEGHTRRTEPLRGPVHGSH